MAQNSTPRRQQSAKSKGRSSTRSYVLPNRAKLLISIVNHGDDETLTEILNDFSVALTFSCLGTGTARSAVLSYLGLGTSEKAIMFSIIPESDEEAILNEIKSKMSLYLVGRGISFTVPLSAVSEIIANGITSAASAKTLDGRKIMKEKDRNYSLIIAEVAAGYVDDAMEAARAVGAAGGTILRARSINNAKAEQFVGISIHEESEILLILAPKEGKMAIMNALSQSIGLKTEAGGILFSVPVDRTVGVGAGTFAQKVEPAPEPVPESVGSAPAAPESPAESK